MYSSSGTKEILPFTKYLSHGALPQQQKSSYYDLVWGTRVKNDCVFKSSSKIERNTGLLFRISEYISSKFLILQMEKSSPKSED